MGKPMLKIDDKNIFDQPWKCLYYMFSYVLMNTNNVIILRLFATLSFNQLVAEVCNLLFCSKSL